jgi:hypothetical protein
VPDLRTEGGGSCEREQRHRRRGSGKAAPAPAYRQHERDHQPELRFVGQKPEQDAGKKRPAIEHDQRAADQRGGEEPVLAVTDVDQHGRKGDSEQEPERIGGGTACSVRGIVDPARR